LQKIAGPSTPVEITGLAEVPQAGDEFNAVKDERMAKELAEQGKTVLLVVHDIDQAMNTADELVLMNKGNVIIQGTPEEVYLSGKIDEVFSVSLNRVHTGKGWRYFCEEA
jgi:ABC-type cobalamin/Fe3+-siderophores transport system ATPase subunit